MFYDINISMFYDINLTLCIMTLTELDVLWHKLNSMLNDIN